MKRFAGWTLASPATLLVLLGLVVPVAATIYTTFGTPGGPLATYQAFFGSNFRRTVLIRTINVSLIVTAIALVVGFITAYVVSRAPGWLKSILIIAAVFPLLTGVVVRSFAWLIILGKNGILNTTLVNLGIITEPLQMLYGEAAVVLGLVHFTLPYVILNIYVSLEGIDRNLVEAARSLGASKWSAFLQVVLPLSLPGLSTGILLCFVLVSGAFITPLILGGPQDFLFGNLVYDTIMSELNLPLGAALACVLLLFLGMFVFVFNRFVGLNQLYKSFR